MENIKNILRNIPKKTKVGLLIALILILSYKHLNFYLRLDFNLIFAIILTPFILYIPDKKVKSYRFGILSLLFLASYPFIKIQSCFFFGVCFLMLFIVESRWGKLNNAAFFLVLLCSPMVSHIVKVFGFPIRLKLTEMSVKVLSHIGYTVQSNGNSILIDGNEFYVEAACIGLKLVITSFLLCLAFIAFYEKQQKKQLPIVYILTNFCFTFGLVVLSNLIRIILLILFKSEENTISHELIGIVCLIVYVILPLYKLIPLSVSIARYQKLDKKDKSLSTGLDKLFISSFTLSLIILIGYYNFNSKIFIHDTYQTETTLIKLNGFESSKVAFDGTKLQNENTLVYLKPCKNYWGADHNPILCWRGSGYQFYKEREIEVNERKIYIAELVKGEDKLYTAWWFSNGKDITNSQIEWRWKMAIGDAPYTLVNVSCDAEQDLLNEVKSFMKKKI